MRLGDLDKAEAVMRNIADHLKEDGRDDLWPSAYAAADVIKSQRTIDAVPVVRCKDCKFFKYGDYCCGDKMEHSHAREDDYCSYGDRKEADGNG